MARQSAAQRRRQQAIQFVNLLGDIRDGILGWFGQFLLVFRAGFDQFALLAK
jgi:hypothetical protein